MFNYLFPIFCFGLVMTGIVFLGIIEAAKQAKSEEILLAELKPREAAATPRSTSDVRHPSFPARSIHE